MKRLSQRLRKQERGSVAVLVAFSITAVIALAALGTDVGRLFVERNRLSTIADAAALSGAQHLPGDPDGASAVARGYLEKNGIDLTKAAVAVSDDHHKLTVVVRGAVPMTFARLVGPDSHTVAGGATAWTTNLSGHYGAAPLGVAQADWKMGERVYLKMDSQSGTVSPGNYQALALGKSGASAYEQNLMSGYNGWIRAGDWIETETGNMAGPTVRAINYRINQDPYSTHISYNRQSPRLVVIPVLKDFNVNGRGEVNVVGFGVFFLENAADLGGNKAEVVGRFVKFITEGEGSDTAPNFGVYTTKLVQ